MTESFREECPFCGHTLYDVRWFEAHTLACGAIDKGQIAQLSFDLKSVSVDNSEDRAVAGPEEKDGPENPSDSVFGEWECD